MTRWSTYPFHARAPSARAANGFYVDRSDASITRTEEHFRAIFARAGLRVVLRQMQPGMPRAIFPVCMFALAPDEAS